MKVAIVFKGSGPGIVKDVEIIRSALSQDGIEIENVMVANTDYIRSLLVGPFSHLRPYVYFLIAVLFSVIRKLTKPKFDMAIYIESCRPWYLNVARRNVLIPNQEWYFKDLLCCLKYFDQIWCKTNDAKNIFSNYHRSVTYLGFSSLIKSECCGENKNENLILHRAGNSLLRGTRTLIKVWTKHPDWPVLSIILSKHLRIEVCSGQLPTNVCYLDGNWNDAEFTQLLSSAAVHIHPTEAEGYGLTISEALGYGCIVLATDAEPMNELVSAQRGYLIAANKSAKFNLADRYKVMEDDLEKTITNVLTADREEIQTKRVNSVAWFVNNQDNFIRRINELTNTLGMN